MSFAANMQVAHSQGAMLTRAPRATCRQRRSIARANMLLVHGIHEIAAHGHDYMPMPRRPRRGFTLIEVMATLLLVGIVLPAIMEGISLANSAGAYAKTSLQATALAQMKLNEIAATTIANAQPTTGVYSGGFASVDPQYGSYKWSAEMTERNDMENELGITGIIELTVRVSWPVRAEERTVAVSTLLYMSQTTTGTAPSTGLSGGAGGTSGGRSTGTQQR